LADIDGSRRRWIAVCAVLLPVLAWVGNPAIALLTGAVIAVAIDRRPLGETSVPTRYALQGAIVLLGLRLDLDTVVSLSAQYTGVVALYVLATLALGHALGRALAVEAPSRKLMSAGTAICGGTAIASLSTLVRAQPQQTSVALAVVFLLNVVALFAFPPLGRALSLTQEQFGLWAALAIHDTSSVVATAAIYGDEAAQVATTIKLGRTLWLIPLIFFTALLEQRAGNGSGEGVPRLRVPGFVLMFVAAAALGSVVDLPAAVSGAAGSASRWLLVVALFLVGTELTRGTLRRIRGRVLVHALGLWLVVAPATLAAVVFWLT
jgi:uncharacterized integral membrane protein (TIGR00698 family)